MRFLLPAALAVALTGCAMTSGIMEAQDGTYMISARAGQMRGGAAEANALAYEEAQKFCGTTGKRALLVSAQEVRRAAM
jgi:hypothetical protein